MGKRFAEHRGTAAVRPTPWTPRTSLSLALAEPVLRARYAAGGGGWRGERAAAGRRAGSPEGRERDDPQGTERGQRARETRGYSWVVRTTPKPGAGFRKAPPLSLSACPSPPTLCGLHPCRYIYHQINLRFYLPVFKECRHATPTTRADPLMLVHKPCTSGVQVRKARGKP